jgi:Tetratricopeptide repeat
MNSSARTEFDVHTIERAPDARARDVSRALPALVLAFRICVFAGCLAAAYFAVRQGVAAWYFHDSVPQDVENAAKWDPGNPRYVDTLANLVHFYSENPNPNRVVELCETATRLSPHDAHYWADLGSAYDWAGRSLDAVRAFERAHQLFPNSPEINWRLANFYVRTNRANDAIPLLQNVLLAGGVEDKQVFSLASNAGLDSDIIMAKILPARSYEWVDYLNFLLNSRNVDAGGEVWAQLLKSGLSFKPGDAFPYFDALIRAQKIDAAWQVWRELADRFPRDVGSRNSRQNLVTNGDFRFPILNGGFDWRVNPVGGATVRVDSPQGSAGIGSLQIDFDGAHNLDYVDVLQFVAVDPSTRYEFSAEVRTRGVTTDSGPRFQIFDDLDLASLFVSTQNLVGTSDWSWQKLTFQTGRHTRLLVVRLARPPSQKLDNKVSGTVSIRKVSLRQEE